MEALALGCGDVLQFDLTRGFVAVVDADRFETPLTYRWLDGFEIAVIPSSLPWFSNESRMHWYAIAHKRCGDKDRKLRLHRLIIEAPANLQVDHISGDTLDNRLRNLRLCTNGQNKWNAKKHRGSVSQFKGVHATGSLSKPWRAAFSSNGKTYHIGVFATEEAAARAYDAAALEHFGEFARLNFPQESPTPSKLIAPRG